MNESVQKFIARDKESAELYRGILERMMNDTDEYEYAEETLQGIYDFIEKEGYITTKQIEAVNNIKDSPSIYEGKEGGYDYAK